MRPDAHIPPDSWAASTAHRALMAGGSVRAPALGGWRGSLVSSALRWTASERPGEAEREALGRVEVRRAAVPFEMAAGDAPFGFGPATGSAPEPEPPSAPADPAANLGAAWEVCRWSTVPPVWGRFLFALVRRLAPRSCLELGTGLGLSALYQSAALELNGRGRLLTLDRDRAARIAERGFTESGLAGRVELEFGDIDATLPRVAERGTRFEFAYLDAEHSEEATVRHFDLVLPLLAADALVVLDDISQTAEMRRAWRTVAARKRVVGTLGLRRLGVVAVS
jgi:predicted O-methyltransferase YrrM